jgi:[ribosomal protein S5]-alanine N-acetyltransferase
MPKGQQRSCNQISDVSVNMTTLRLSPITLRDLDDVLTFEIANRSFFEAHVNARPADYYSREGVAVAIDTAISDASKDRAYQFLVRDDHGVLIGRANLTHVRRAHFHSAQLGYRIAQSENGKGCATTAVRQTLAVAFSELRLLRIEATARAENVGSTKVLRQNGFTQFGHSRRSVQLHGIWYDLLHYEKHAEATN